jgi:CheY-like chemotaxis protein
MIDLSPATPRDPPLVLLVDQNVDTLEMCEFALRDSGFGVDTAHDGNEALAKVRSAMPDVVITDIVLSGMDGFSLCREIKQDRRTAVIPVIAVTGYSTPTRLEEAERAGFDAFILKPCGPDDLIVRIRQTIQTSRTIRAQSAALRTEAKRLQQDTKAIREQSASILTRLSAGNAPWRYRKR